MEKCNKCKKELGYINKDGNEVKIIGFNFTMTANKSDTDEEKAGWNKQLGIYKDLKEFNLCLECWFSSMGVKP